MLRGRRLFNLQSLIAIHFHPDRVAQSAAAINATTSCANQVVRFASVSTSTKRKMVSYTY